MEKSDIVQTKIIKDSIYNKLQEINRKYYKAVLTFLNMLFGSESESILKIKLNKITLNNDILEIYNHIVTKYKLNKDLINIDYFDFNIEYEKKDVIKITLIICNNLLEKLNYKLINYKNSSQKQIFKIIINES
jgi:hypothetical protein